MDTISERATLVVSVLAVLWAFVTVCVIGTLADDEEEEAP